MAERQSSILIDHGDMRPIAAGADESVADRNDIVQLNPDHPGFRDPEYRARRNAIARIALEYRSGEVPRVEYQPREQETWRAVWKSLGPLAGKRKTKERRPKCKSLALSLDTLFVD